MRLAAWPFLFLLLLIPLLFRWWMDRNRPPRVAYSLPVAAGVAMKSPLKILMAVRLIALVLLLVALARPQTSFRQTERSVSGLDIMLVLDVSASMNIEDLAERSRLEMSKDVMERFIKGRSSDRIGMVMFSGEPLTLAPPTLDYGLLLRGLRDVETGVLKDGTGIGDGLTLGLSHLRASKAKSKVVILLTDGDNNVGQVDPVTAGDLAAGYGIKVYTIAMGREGRVRMPIKHKGILGNTVVQYQWMDNALNPELLMHIAKLTGGKFYRVTEAGALDQVFQEIDRLEKTDIKAREKIRYEEKYQSVLSWALLLLLLEMVLAHGWWRLVP